MEKTLAREIYRRLDRIEDIARELERAFERPPGYQDTRGFDKKCKEVRVHSDWIREHLDDEDPDEWTRTGSIPIVKDPSSTHLTR